MACASPLKRPFESGNHESIDRPRSPSTPEPFDKEPSALNASRTTSPLSVLSSMPHISPPLSPADHSSIVLAANPSAAMASLQPPSKKRKKLTNAERQQKEEERLRKEAEKNIKEDEKKLKQAQAEEARKIKAEKEEEKRRVREIEKAKRDESKRQKEAEKKAKEEEKAKKERAQKRISSFFSKPSTDTVSANSSRRNSVSSLDETVSVACSPSKPRMSSVVLTDYEKTFPPFFIHPHTTIAPVIRHPLDPSSAVKDFEEDLKAIAATRHTAEALDTFRKETLTIFGKGLKPRKLDADQPSVKHLRSRIEGFLTANSMDLTSSSTSVTRSLEVLQSLPMKYLKYREDVRPPWIGTYTKTPQSKKDLVRLCRNPFTRALPEVNYDYDSEAEWEEGGEGEELGPGSEDEEDGNEDEGDMDGFLDDEEAEGMPKRKKLLGDMEPIYTSMHWESSNRKDQNKILPYGFSNIDMASFQMGILLASQSFPIDPYSTSYWASSPATSPRKLPSSQQTLIMPPPNRTPLLILQGPNQLAFTKDPPKQNSTTKSAKAGTVKPLAAELLSDFKNAVDGSDLTKLGLIEVLKKKFPSATKGTLETTLSQIAVREGPKPSEKRWKLISA